MTLTDKELAEEARIRSVTEAFFAVYNELGFGFLESVYSAALERELRRRGHEVAREVRVQVYFRGVPVAWHRLDMIADRCLVIENKSTELLPKVAHRQLQNYVCATKLEVGLLLHFGPEPKLYRHVSRNPPGR